MAYLLLPVSAMILWISYDTMCTCKKIKIKNRRKCGELESKMVHCFSYVCLYVCYHSLITPEKEERKKKKEKRGRKKEEERIRKKKGEEEEK